MRCAPPGGVALRESLVSCFSLSPTVSPFQNHPGTIVCVTHNRDFCEKIKATHVAMVRGDGSVAVDDRPIRPSDWDEISRLEKGAQNAGERLA